MEKIPTAELASTPVKKKTLDELHAENIELRYRLNEVVRILKNIKWFGNICCNNDFVEDPQENFSKVLNQKGGEGDLSPFETEYFYDEKKY